MTVNPGTITMSVLYPRDEGATFDMDYYLATHMKLAEKAWQPHGMKSWNVIEVPPSPDALYSVHSFITWEARGKDGMEGLMAGVSSDLGKELTADVVNFSNRTPKVIIGPVKASGTV